MMSYRRPAGFHPAGPRWLQRHRVDLLPLGIPDEILIDPRRWIYVLLHGVDEFHTGWSPSAMSPGHARQLLQLLRRDLEAATAGYMLVRLLDDRARADMDGSWS
jgi:hypothetical protein